MAKKKKQVDWAEVNREILGKLDMLAEFAAIGINVTGEPRESGWAECYAIGRDDSKPSAAVNVLSGRYRDLGGDGLSLSFYDLAVHQQKFTRWQDARDHYAARAGVKLDNSTRDPAEHLHFLAWNENLAALWCKTKPGIAPEAIRAAGGRIARYRDQYTVIALPIYGPGFTAADPTGWVLWNVTGKELPIFRKDKATCQCVTEWKKMKTTGGSEGGLLGQHAIDRLAAADVDPSQQLIWKVEGPSDLLALWSAVPADKRDRHLILTNSGGATERPAGWMGQLFSGRLVAVVGDADVPGQKGVEIWSQWSSGFAGETRAVSAESLGFQVEANHGKDLRDFFTSEKEYSDLANIAKESPIVEQNKAAGKHTAGSHVSPAVEPATASGSPAAQNTPAVPSRESDDDPHRLARVNLERYATRNDGRTLAYWRDEWYVWKKNAYHKISKEELRAKISLSIKNEFDRISAEKQAEADARPPRDGDQQPIVAQKVTMSLVSNVMQAMSGMVCISADIEPNTWLPTKERKHYISMGNGLLDIDAALADRDDYLLPNSPKWFSMVSLPYAFEINATCPKWQAFLEFNLEMDPERIKFLQEWAGYLLTPSTDEQAFLILEGEGKNGKSVYIAGISAMIGKENISNVSLESFGERFELTQTIGKLLNAVDDCGDLDKVAEGRLKTFVSGASMFFDRKGVEGYSKVPTARLMVACNSRPHFSDRSDAIWRRMKIVPWKVTVPEEKRIKGMDKTCWWQASGELPGIFWWALQGLARLQKQNGFTYVQASMNALKEYKEEMNPARVFLQNYLEASQTGVIQIRILYKIYKKWIEENGYRPLAERTFGKEVFRVFRSVNRTRLGPRGERIWCYEGIQFTECEICEIKTSEALLF